MVWKICKINVELKQLIDVKYTYLESETNLIYYQQYV
jgi:hypothetical protein